ncbi:hypothetical protein [Pandoraea pnomenusa]|uniref:hypothetical protein n=1 Tax=Pandoraea pnomenusa TaxID=93220 RepID=UPI00333F7499
MKRLLSVLAFLAGGLSVEAVHPLQCDLAPSSRRITPETERARRRAGPGVSGDENGGSPQRASL